MTEVFQHSFTAHCHEPGCVETLELVRTAPEFMDETVPTRVALSCAEVFLGWRVFDDFHWCPTHVIAKGLACKRCLLRCPDCLCMGGPFIDAVEGQDDDDDT